MIKKLKYNVNSPVGTVLLDLPEYNFKGFISYICNISSFEKDIIENKIDEIINDKNNNNKILIIIDDDSICYDPSESIYECNNYIQKRSCLKLYTIEELNEHNYNCLNCKILINFFKRYL